MNQTLMQFKIACLSYTQQPITYRQKHYHVTDLLGLRAETLTACQRLIRANLKGSYNMGETIRKRTDEEAFIIEPIMQIASLEDEQKNAMFERLKNDKTFISHLKDFMPPTAKHMIEAEQMNQNASNFQQKLHTIHIESEDNNNNNQEESVYMEYV